MQGCPLLLTRFTETLGTIYRDEVLARLCCIILLREEGLAPRYGRQSTRSLNRRRTLTPFGVHLTPSELSRITEIQRRGLPAGRSRSYVRPMSEKAPSASAAICLGECFDAHRHPIRIR
jgi:hypothetical protein